MNQSPIHQDVYVWLRDLFKEDRHNALDICIYTTIMISTLILGLMRSTLHFYISVIASKKLHERMLNAIFR